MNQTATEIDNEILNIYSSTKDLKDREILHSQSDYLMDFFNRLDYLAALDIDDQDVQQMIGTSQKRNMLKSIVRFRDLYSLRLEVEKANSILDSSDPWNVLRGFTHFTNYFQLAKTEYEGSALKQGDCVVFLGSGPLPLSLIILCHYHGLNGIGIEQEPDRVELSRKVIKKLGLSDQIRIIDGNHFTLPISSKCDLLMVAAAAQPKTEVFAHLADVVPPRAKLSYRFYEKGLRRLLEIPAVVTLPEMFEEYLRIRPRPPVNNTVVFLTKVVS
ncbi:MAG: nicotianamine synthase family protein [Methanosarcinales archaeon]